MSTLECIKQHLLTNYTTVGCVVSPWFNIMLRVVRTIGVRLSSALSGRHHDKFQPLSGPAIEDFKLLAVDRVFGINMFSLKLCAHFISIAQTCYILSDELSFNGFCVAWIQISRQNSS